MDMEKAGRGIRRSHMMIMSVAIIPCASLSRVIGESQFASRCGKASRALVYRAMMSRVNSQTAESRILELHRLVVFWGKTGEKSQWLNARTGDFRRAGLF